MLSIGKSIESTIVTHNNDLPFSISAMNGLSLSDKVEWRHRLHRFGPCRVIYTNIFAKFAMVRNRASDRRPKIELKSTNVISPVVFYSSFSINTLRATICVQ